LVTSFGPMRRPPSSGRGRSKWARAGTRSRPSPPGRRLPLRYRAGWLVTLVSPLRSRSKQSNLGGTDPGGQRLAGNRQDLGRGKRGISTGEARTVATCHCGVTTAS
jgi:hypothetical protein